ncbi:MFS transporter [Clostridium sp. P21]|uniref:MFS transporter n=1 Tax=Clostridium muellerianum TaxID=2716538 RepID=A0A7Y0EDZ4_9CLOT|nr:MFS transporter [Clostridium muellerianum]NMM61685.1 MFS transporter [Clostridium muellerianum]
MENRKSVKNATLPYAILQSMVWGNFGVLICYAGKYCLAQGFSNTQYGVIFGLVSGSAFILQVLLAQIIGKSSKKDALSLAILVQTGLTVICGVILCVSGIHRYLAVALLAIMCILLQVFPAMVDSLGIQKIQSGMNINLGMARGWGSLAYSLLTCICGWCIALFGINTVPLMGGFLAFILFIGVKTFPDNKIAVDQEGSKNSGKGKLWNKSFALTLTGFFLLYASHNFLCNYMYQIVVARGGNESTQGMATAFGAILELPAMFLIVKLMKVKRCDFWLKASGIFITMKAVLYFISGTMVGLYSAQLMQLGGFSLFSISAVYYIGSTVSKENSVIGQTYRAATCTFSNLLAYFLGGVVCDYSGSQAVILYSIGCGLVGTIILFMSCCKIEKVVGED